MWHQRLLLNIFVCITVRRNVVTRCIEKTGVLSENEDSPPSSPGANSNSSVHKSNQSSSSELVSSSGSEDEIEPKDYQSEHTDNFAVAVTASSSRDPMDEIFGDCDLNESVTKRDLITFGKAFLALLPGNYCRFHQSCLNCGWLNKKLYNLNQTLSNSYNHYVDSVN